MLEKDLEGGVRLPEGRKDEVTKKKFIFNTKDESIKLQRTQKNIFN